jgi:hypothetical protein
MPLDRFYRSIVCANRETARRDASYRREECRTRSLFALPLPLLFGGDKRGNNLMKNVIMWIVAIVLIWLVARVILGLVFGLLHWVIIIGVIALFVYLVYSFYKASQRQKI